MMHTGAVHLRTLTMAATLRGGATTTMVARGRASWWIQEDERWRRQCNKHPVNERQMGGKV
jgi:hypothetical protein